MSCQEREIASGGGEIIAGAFYRHTGTFSMEGALKTSDLPVTWTLSAALILANSVDLSADVEGYTSGATFVLSNSGATLGAEAEERRTISGKVYPFLAAAN